MRMLLDALGANLPGVGGPWGLLVTYIGLAMILYAIIGQL